MRMVDLIEKKKLGGCHDETEIRFIVQGFTLGEIPDYQMAAWLMAVRFQGLTQPETVTLTLAMAQSGKQLDLSTIEGIKVDKHSTGGVADTTTLIAGPLAAAAGVKVAKMAGRGLGFTGGTIDKLESIPGFRTALNPKEFVDQVQRVGLAVMGQTADLAPADGKMYALRDATSTVDSLPLIAASVMSKKIAAGADKILLDVKFGSGAFMKNIKDATALAQWMVDIGTGAGRQTEAIVSSMEEPLGTVIGNSMEVEEAVEVLSGVGDARLRDFCILLAARMLKMAKPELEMTTATTAIREKLKNGDALAKFEEFVIAQGGNGRVVREPSLLGRASGTVEIRTDKAGYISGMNSADLGRAALRLGAGRAQKDDAIDLTAGIKLHRRCGEFVKKGELLATLFFSDAVDPTASKMLVKGAFHLTPKPKAAGPLIAGILDESGWRISS